MKVQRVGVVRPWTIKAKVLVITVMAIVIYLLVVFWYAWTRSQRRLADVVPNFSEIKKAECDYIGKYHRIEAPEGEATAWLLQDYLTVHFDQKIMSDPLCLGKLLSDISANMQAHKSNYKVLVRIYDYENKKVVHRFVVYQ